MIRSKSNMRFQILANFILILFTIFVITPFILLIMSSFTEESTLIRNGYSFFPEKFSLENDCFPQLLEAGGIYALESRGYFIDIGVPEDYYKAQQYFEQKGNSH